MYMLCRICGNKTHKIDEIIDNVVDVTHYYNMPVNNNSHIIDIYSCPYCNHIQTKECMDNNYYDNYNLMYNSDDNKSQYPKRLISYYQQCLKKASEFCINFEYALDVGCASGDLFPILSEMFKKCIGIEPSSKLAAQANEKGYVVINDYFSSKIDFGVKFDFVSSLMVLEHISDISEFMNALNSCLNEDGVVFINVPNGQKIIGTCAYNDFFDEHINYFTTESIIELSRKYNFELIYLEEGFTDGMHLTFMLKKKKKNIKMSDKKKIDKEIINNIINEHINIGFWGMGVRSRNLLEMLNNKEKVKYLFDINVSISGKYVPGLNRKIMVPSANRINECDLIFISSIEYYKEIISDLKENYCYQGDICYLENGKFKLMKIGECYV